MLDAADAPLFVWGLYLKTMKTFILLTTLLFLSISVFAKKFDPPNINIEEAITIAKEHIAKKNSTMSEKYIIQKVEFLNIYNEYEAAHWNIRWERLPRTKGGWFEIKIYNNGNIESHYGE